MPSLFRYDYWYPKSPEVAAPVPPAPVVPESACAVDSCTASDAVQGPTLPCSVPYSQNLAFSNQRTRNQFRPRNANKGTTSYQLRQYAEATLGGGSLRKIVKLPEGEDENEWLAVNSEMICVRFRGRNADANSGRLLQSHQPALWLHY